MKLVVGLGNPGNKYNFTRHNFGFLALDFYAKIHSASWEKMPKFDAEWLKINDVIYIKPQTFYNEVGRAVQAFRHFYKIDLRDILIVADDFNLPFGVLRYRAKGSDGGNNGLKSIIRDLSSENVPRLRIGTNNPELRSKIGDVDFVLGKFTDAEKGQLPEILSSISERIREFAE